MYLEGFLASKHLTTPLTLCLRGFLKRVSVFANVQTDVHFMNSTFLLVFL